MGQQKQDMEEKKKRMTHSDDIVEGGGESIYTQ